MNWKSDKKNSGASKVSSLVLIVRVVVYITIIGLAVIMHAHHT